MNQFSKEETKDVVTIRCPAILDSAAAKELSDQSKLWTLSPAPAYVLDFGSAKEVKREFYNAVMQLRALLKQNEKVIYSVNIPADIILQIRRDGVERAFCPISSLDEVFKRKKASMSINVGFINPFLVSTQKTLEVQCQTLSKVQKPYLKKENTPNVAIAGVLTLISNGFSGSVVLCFSQSVFLRIYNNMFGENHEKISSEMEDAAGELLNIIYGGAKTELNQNGFNFQKALPTVLVGDRLKVRQAGLAPTVVVPFEMDAGLFHIEIEFDKTMEEGNSV